MKGFILAALTVLSLTAAITPAANAAYYGGYQQSPHSNASNPTAGGGG
jgi:hypothetical protein